MSWSPESFGDLVYGALYLALMIPIPLIVTVAVPIAVLVKLRSLRRNTSPAQDGAAPTGRQLLMATLIWLVVCSLVLRVGSWFWWMIFYGPSDDYLPRVGPFLILMAMVSAQIGVGGYYVRRLEARYGTL